MFESTAGYGSWIYYHKARQVFFSSVAAEFMGVAPAVLHDLPQGLQHVVEEDLNRLCQSIQDHVAGEFEGCDFRVLQSNLGLRCLRLKALPVASNFDNIIFGTLVDVTASQHAFMRERLAFELTECLMGASHFDNTIVNAIKLICNSLDWEWGAYWSMQPSDGTAGVLRCVHAWHKPGYELAPFEQQSMKLSLSAGQGLIGEVWQSGVAQWVEAIEANTAFLRRDSARRAGLLSGFVFPVTYTKPSGARHCSGVLEFYSAHVRQPDAQLPQLSASIGALIAQTSQRLEREAVIFKLAHFDSLTGLINRNSFSSRLDELCAVSRQSGKSFGIFVIDLERLKPIYDTFGHEVGDRILQDFSSRLRAISPNDAIIGRMGGNEFGMLIHDDAQPLVMRLFDAILRAARTPLASHEMRVALSAEVVFSRFPFNGTSASELLRSAYVALHLAKTAGRQSNGIVSEKQAFELDDIRESLAMRLTLEAELNHAIERQELSLVYQPIFDVPSGKIHAIEALVRWHNQKHGQVGPDVFIPIAEQSHLIFEIGQWVLAKACQDLADFHRWAAADLKVHINMAASEFSNPDLPGRLQALAGQYQIAPNSIVLELTEGMLMQSPATVIPVMRQLRAAGFEISLDDFGMGHSSLSMLKDLPISSMKVDRSFIRQIEENASDHAIAKMIIALGGQLNLAVIVEGVETEGQLAWLKAAHCSLIQGYLLGRPMGKLALLRQHFQAEA